MNYRLPLLLFGLLLLLLAACSNVGYYSQSISGHLSIMAASRPIDRMLVDPDVPDALKQKLSRALAFRRFASDELHLPDNGSYLTYADTGRSAAVWNVVAAPDDSLTPVQWCFPFVGCLPYRGYYAESDAEAFAAGLKGEGLDVLTYGVPAYSTLGWFNDPLLNTLIDLPDWALAGVMFHELAHQTVYADDDAVFNEAFAQTVEEEGRRRWLEHHGNEAERATYRRFAARQAEFQALVGQTRAALLDCYADGRPHDERLVCKADVIDRMLERYAALKQSWDGYSGYDGWFDPRPNNASFVSAHTYRHYVPAFEQLLAQQGGDLQKFYTVVGQLAELPAAERRQRMEALLQPLKQAD